MSTVKKPNKIKNTGILFELLTRQVTSEIIESKPAKASKLISKYFHNTELGKEYILYNTLEKKQQISESIAISLFDTIEKLYKKIDLEKVESEKYRLIKEIKDTYSTETFFNTRIPQYRLFGSIQQWLTASRGDKFVHPDEIQKPRQSILEHITNVTVEEEDESLEEYRALDKPTKFMVYKIMVEKFNDKYKTLPDSQKGILSEYLLSVSNNDKLTKFVQAKQIEAKELLSNEISLTEDTTIKQKLNEVLDQIKPFKKGYVVNEDDVIKVLQHFELIDQLKIVNGSSK